MKNLLLLSFLVGLILCTSCRKDEPDVIYPYDSQYNNDDNIDNIPNGGTGTVSDVNLSGQGNQTVTYGTTLVISGDVIMDDLTITGTAILSDGASLTVTGTTTVVGGGNFEVEGNLNTNVLVQTGDTYLDNGKITVNSKYQIVGGSTLYIQNSDVHVDELEVIGSISQTENDYTKNTNVYSVIEAINSKLLWIVSGANICGPVLFTTKEDRNSPANSTFTDVTSEVFTVQPEIKSIYFLENTTTNFYSFNNSCTPLNIFPQH